MSHQNLILLLLLLGLTACNHTVKLPGSFQQRPEVGGRLGGGDFNLSLERMTAVEIFDDITSNPPVRAQGTNDSLSDIIFPVLPSLNLNIGLLSYLDVYYNGNVGLKYMFLGQPNKEGWKSTLFAGVMNQEDSTEYGSGANKAVTKSTGFEYGISVGKSIGKSSLAYLTLGQIQADAKTDITQPSLQFKYNDKFEHRIATLGITAGEKFYFNAEISHSNTVWHFDEGGEDEVNATSWLLGGGFRW